MISQIRYIHAKHVIIILLFWQIADFAHLQHIVLNAKTHTFYIVIILVSRIVPMPVIIVNYSFKYTYKKQINHLYKKHKY